MSVLQFVNAKIGSRNERRFSNGNVYPVTACPFGMAHFCIQNDGANGGWFYDPTSHAFEGFRLTHQPSPWVGDYGHMLLLPFTGKLHAEPSLRWSSFRPDRATVAPDRLDVYLSRYRLRAALAPTERGCILSLENGSDARTGFALVPFAASRFSIENNVLTGYTDSQSIWNFKRIREYFHITFSAEIVASEPLENGGIAVYFDRKAVEIKAATGFISKEQTARNHRSELADETFDTARAKAAALWEGYLSRIAVSDEDPARKRTFYSCMYRALLYPRKFYEYDANGLPQHFNADTGKSEKGVFYTDNGFWDTFRTEYPFLTLIAPNTAREMLEGFLNYADETGWLPKWLSPGEIGVMPGTLIEAVLADAVVKGVLDGELVTRAYQAALHSAFAVGEGRHGRKGLIDYMRYGYIPNDVSESVNNTCDCAYGDFCVAQIARAVGDETNAAALQARSRNWRNLFDGQTGFLRGKDRDGKFRVGFDPYDWGGDCCEGSSWQNGFGVYHDVEGLAEVYGGRKGLEQKLDALFAAQPKFNVGGYGFEIHEMSEMACADFGQCAISNQPSFHIPWLYTAIGAREKAAYWVERLATQAFSAADDGLPGDDDNGTTACWFLFACMGFYPLCPGKAEYVAAKPLFDTVTLCGRTIEALPDVVSHAQLLKKERAR